MEGMVNLFFDKAKTADTKDKEAKQAYTQIRQVAVERDFVLQTLKL